MTLLTKQNYLEKMKSATATGSRGAATQGSIGGQKGNKEGGDGDQTVEWKWGSRSEVEFGEAGIARFMTAIFLAADKDGGNDDEEDDDDGVPIPRNANRNKNANANGGEKSAGKILSEISRAAGDRLKEATKAALS